MTQGIMERALTKPEEKALPSIQSRSTGHGRVHYDGSAQRSKSAPSLNECSETGPPLQNKLLSVLAKNGFCGSSRRSKTSVLASEDQRGRPRLDAISLVEGLKDQASGTTQIHTSTIRAVHNTIPSWRSYRSAPAKPSAELPK